MAWQKVVFDHTLITSEFLNELQDYIIMLESRPQFVPYEEDNNNVVPASGTSDLNEQGSFLNRDTQIGDIVLGNRTMNYARVTATDGQFMTVTGLGHF